MSGRRWMRVMLAWAAALLLAGVAFAQDGPVRVVTDDDVNAVAYGLYCPVCPNERLDSCMTEACVSWREDIRAQLEAGRTPEEVVADFVARYGERAVGIPLDPFLRAFSIYTPYLFALAALVLAVITLLRWRGRRQVGSAPVQPAAAGEPQAAAEDRDYRALLERDLRG